VREVKPMAVITISREIYSDGSYIGEKTAQALGYHFAGKNTIEKVFLEYGLFEFKKVYESTEGFWSRFEDMRATTIEFLKQVILALASHGNMVIVGRGAFAVLGGFADVLNIWVQAPFDIRVKRAMKGEKIPDLGKAEEFLRESDRARDAFVESFYNVRLKTAAPQAFDLAINTGKVSPETAIAWLVEAHKALKQREKAGEPSTNTIVVEPDLARTVSEVLGCHLVHES
jgi:cytidylate kinase